MWVISTSWILNFYLNFTGMAFFFARKDQESIMWILLKSRTNSHPGQEDIVMEVENSHFCPLALIWVLSDPHCPPHHHPGSWSHCSEIETGKLFTYWTAANKDPRHITYKWKELRNRLLASCLESAEPCTEILRVEADLTITTDSASHHSPNPALQDTKPPKRWQLGGWFLQHLEKCSNSSPKSATFKPKQGDNQKGMSSELNSWSLGDGVLKRSGG